ncbi:MAG: response regulator [Lacunisphaera sp.]
MDAPNQPDQPIKTPPEWVLLVDDDQHLREIVTEQLLSLRVQVLAADRGETAREIVLLKSSAPFLAIIDVMMPGMDGFTLARRLISRFKRKTRIVIISGHLTAASWWPADLREATFLPKPFRFSDIERIVAEARAARSQPE